MAHYLHKMHINISCHSISPSNIALDDVQMLSSFVLFCFVLFCFVLFCFVLFLMWNKTYNAMQYNDDREMYK